MGNAVLRRASSTATNAAFPSIAASQRLSDRTNVLGDYCTDDCDYGGASTPDSNAGGLWVTEE